MTHIKQNENTNKNNIFYYLYNIPGFQQQQKINKYRAHQSQEQYSLERQSKHQGQIRYDIDDEIMRQGN